MKSLKVLAVGNSFSMDAMEYLWQITKNAGYEKIILGNLYIPGCSLETHWRMVRENGANYDYYKNINGTWELTQNTSLINALKKEHWDIITLQQVSSKSGLKDTFQPYLRHLLDYIHKHCLNDQLKIAWHMTWAYEGTHTNPAFNHFDYDQLKMYQAIVNNVKELILTNQNFKFVIPCGTAIQNVRRCYGDCITRDGYHLSLGLGRYTAGLMWFKSITDESVVKITYYPEEVTEHEMKIAKLAVQKASEFPYQVTHINI